MHSIARRLIMTILVVGFTVFAVNESLLVKCYAKEAKAVKTEKAAKEESEKVSQQVFKERSVKKAWEHYVSKVNWQTKGL